MYCSMNAFTFQKLQPIGVTQKFLKYSHIYIFLAILCIHFSITYLLLYERYVLFEMFEATDSAAYMQVSWSIFNGTPFTTSIQDMWVSHSPHNFLGDQLMFTLSLFSPCANSFFTWSSSNFISKENLREVLSINGITSVLPLIG